MESEVTKSEKSNEFFMLYWLIVIGSMNGSKYFESLYVGELIAERIGLKGRPGLWVLGNPYSKLGVEPETKREFCKLDTPCFLRDLRKLLILSSIRKMCLKTSPVRRRNLEGSDNICCIFSIYEGFIN